MLYVAGNWSTDVRCSRRICPWQLLDCLHYGMSPLEACEAAYDIWSAGVLLAELATGALPFPGESTLLAEGQGAMPATLVSIHNSPVCIQAQNAEWVSCSLISCLPCFSCPLS